MQAHTKDQIFDKLKTLFIETFEIEEAIITPEATLYEEIGLDSIDAIDLIIQLQELTGKRIQPEEFKTVRTVQDVVDVIHATLQQ